MNILYGLAGFGFGHAARGKRIIDFLKSQGHTVKIITFGQSIEFLKKYFPEDLVEIHGYKSYFSENKLAPGKILLKIIQGIPSVINTNFSVIRKIIKNFKIDVIINDFEATSRWWARATNLPMITIDNQFMTHLCKIKSPAKFLPSRIVSDLLMGLFFPWGDWRFILSLDPESTPAKKIFSSNTFIVPPILRNEVFELKPKTGDSILVYQTATLYKKKLITTLKQVNEKFICYNLDEEEGTFGNITFKKFSQSGILNDLANAKAVIQNGGFTLMGEAIYLHKPVLSLPIKGDFEQLSNALVLEKKGWGMLANDINAETINRFREKLPVYQEKINKYQQNRNSIFEKKLLRVLKKIEIGE
jgi:uncharacterized protein (TIGR00661 family)